MPAVLVDPDWQEAATDNARRWGKPWAVWGTRKDRPAMPLVLLCSKASKSEAEEIADYEENHLRPRRQWLIIVVYEGEGSNHAV